MPSIDPKKLPPAGKVRFWKGQIERWSRDGRPLEAYCRDHGLPRGSMRYWKKRLEGEIVPEGQASSKTPILVQVPITASGHFGADEGHAPLHVLAGRHWIEVGDDFNPVLLTKLVLTLERIR